MLARKFRLTKEKDFQKIFKQGKSFFSPLFKLKVLKNDFGTSRFAVVVSNKISKKATVRNRLRRQISEIVRINWSKLKSSFDVVIIVKEDILRKDYGEIEKKLLESLKKAKIFK